MAKLLTAALLLASLAAFGADKKDEEAPAILEAGTAAPDFTLHASTGETVTLSKFRGKKNVVLYFYPKDFTPGCTIEAEGFRDAQAALEKAGAVVFGLSVDDPKSHKAFAGKLELNFPLLSDIGGKVAAQYGVMGWIMAKRVTYIIGKDGTVKQVFPEVNPEGHAQAVLKLVEGLAGGRR